MIRRLLLLAILALGGCSKDAVITFQEAGMSQTISVAIDSQQADLTVFGQTGKKLATITPAGHVLLEKGVNPQDVIREMAQALRTAGEQQMDQGRQLNACRDALGYLLRPRPLPSFEEQPGRRGRDKL